MRAGSRDVPEACGYWFDGFDLAGRVYDWSCEVWEDGLIGQINEGEFQ